MSHAAPRQPVLPRSAPQPCCQGTREPIWTRWKEAARSEGTLTWYIAQVDAETAETLGHTFTKEHPGISVAVIRTTGQVAYQRLLMDIKNHTPQCDVFSTTDISHMPVLKERHELAEFQPENAPGLMPRRSRLCRIPAIIMSTTRPAISSSTTPRRCSPRTHRNPGPICSIRNGRDRSPWGIRRSAAVPASGRCALRKLYGWEFFEKLAKNNPRIGRSAADPITLLTAGECLVAPGSANGAYPAAEKGNPIGINHPTDGLVLCVTPSAIPANAPHPNAGRLFMEWLLSEGYSRLIASDGSEPIRVGVPPRADEPPLAEQKVIHVSVEEIRKGVPEVIEQWRDTFGS